MSRYKINCAVLLVLLASAAPVLAGGNSRVSQRRRPKPRPAAVCGDPTAACRTTYEFKPHQLPFMLPSNAVIFETEQFYAVILKSVRDTRQDCTAFVPEAERLRAQSLFPHNKVFASRCSDPEELFYTGVAPNQQIMAVYAGRTRADAARVLAAVRATGKYPGANLRRMRSGFNGT
ncbi:MAG TPA: hypothetical protein VM934_07910 [Pyrinomonadaceae bacterium]|jgi:hypothetical protein|nr:hypothetical protein [Pyrinomonadaceae bacterium]